MSKKVNVFIDYPLSTAGNFVTLSFPQVLYNYLKEDERINVVTDENATNIDIIVVFSGGSQYAPAHNQFIEKLRRIFIFKYGRAFVYYLNFFANRFLKFRWLKARHSYYEKRLDKLLKRNPNAKVVHRLDDRYRALCKVYGYDETIKQINKKATATIHQSDYCQKIWEEGMKTIFGFEEGIKTVNPVRINNGVDSSIFRPDGEKLDLKGRYKIIHVAATGMPRKGLKMVLFLAEMLQNNPDFQFYLVGRQETDPLSGHRIKNFDNVHQLEFTTDRQVLAKYYRSCDVMLFPSENDCSPNVVLEALSSGLPVIASDSGGTPEMIKKEDLQAGVLIHPDNPVFAMKVVVENLEEFSQNALKMVEKYYSKEVMGKACVDLFVNLTKQG